MKTFLFTAIVMAMVGCGAAHAQQASDPADHQAAADTPRIDGPARIEILDKAILMLPSEMAFMQGDDPGGADPGEDSPIIGRIFPKEASDYRDAPWEAVIAWYDSGHISDADAGVFAAGPPIQPGWIEAPHYDAASHRLTWAEKSHEMTKDSFRGGTLQARILGRNGYLYIQLYSANTGSIEFYQPAMKDILQNISFNAGERYQDYRSPTDGSTRLRLRSLMFGIAPIKLAALSLPHVDRIAGYGALMLFGLILASRYGVFVVLAGGLAALGAAARPGRER